MPVPDANPRPRNALRRLIAEHPEARRRLGRAYAEFLLVLLAAIGGLSALVLWHLARRGRLIRDRLGQPRPLDWPGGDHQPGRDHDRDHDRDPDHDTDRDRTETP